MKAVRLAAFPKALDGAVANRFKRSIERRNDSFASNVLSAPDESE
jgi:hypothetical protein